MTALIQLGGGWFDRMSSEQHLWIWPEAAARGWFRYVLPSDLPAPGRLVG